LPLIVQTDERLLSIVEVRMDETSRTLSPLFYKAKGFIPPQGL
jgi:hypothetical protein